MADERYTSKFAPMYKRPKSQMLWLSGPESLAVMLKAAIPLSVWLCIGAIVQTTLIFLPLSSFTNYWRLYVTLPPVLFVLAKIINTALITFGLKANPYLPPSTFINNKVTSLVPDLDGNLPGVDEAPNKNKVAVLMLGMSINHPLSYLAPQVKKVNELGGRMFRELETRPQDETGFLGQSSFLQHGPNGRFDTYLISYWRSIEAIHNYAAGPTHTETIAWWNKESKADKLGHIGIMHEIFEAGEGAWESIYENFHPTTLGATTYLKKADGKGIEAGKIADEWISPIIDARGKLRSSRGRLGWDAYREKR